MKQYNPIITNARTGKPLSALNHKRRNPWPVLLTLCALFWLTLATIVILSIR